MKKAKHIFIPLFLMVMLFTVVQYIPLNEEENSSVIELAKKNSENNEAENDADDYNDDDFVVCEVNYAFENKFTIKLFCNEITQSLIDFNDISVPPPKAV